MMVTTLVTAGTLLILDLAFLGGVARAYYDSSLGPLRRAQVHAGAAALFYVMYLAFVLTVCILPSTSPRQAARRGAALGLLAYATYELTNWAVIAGWPARLVPVDIAWGVTLTAAAGWVGKAVDVWMGRIAIDRTG